MWAVRFRFGVVVVGGFVMVRIGVRMSGDASGIGLRWLIGV